VKKLLVTSAATLAMAASAFGADLGPVYKAPPLYDGWAGAYLGAALGAKWGNTTWTTASVSDFPGETVDASSPRNFDPVGARIGGYGGYNWRHQAWVYGVEFDLAYANSTISAAGVPGCVIGCVVGTPGPGVDTSSVRLGWDASARLRAGYLLTPGVLLYGTGGIAWQYVQTSGLCQHSGPDPLCLFSPGNPFDSQTNSKTLTGWTVGGGIESKVYGNWLLRGEYRYANFGSFNGLLPFAAPGGPPGTDYVRYNLAVNTHIATIGLAYRFGAPAPGNY
jgi:outer membrane immunogenic protein